MTRKETKRNSQEIKAMMSQEEDFLRPLIKVALQEVLEAEMSEAVGAAKGERERRSLPGRERQLSMPSRLPNR